MNSLVDPAGKIRFGIYDEPIGHLNYLDYRLTTPMGLPVLKFQKRLKFNQFHFFGMLGPDFLCGMAVVDLKTLSNGFFYVYDRQEKKLFETKTLKPLNRNATIGPNPDAFDSRFTASALSIDMQGNEIYARGKNIAFSAKLDLPRPNPLRICSRAGYRGWVYTQKTSPIPMRGEIEIKGKRHEVKSPEYMGLMDWTGGYMRRYTFWNWAATAATLPDGRSFGLNLSCGVNETSFTENAFWLDDAQTKITTVLFDFDEGDYYRPWRITSADGRVDLTFTPEAERGEKVHAGFVASRFRQFMGVLDGRVVTEAGESVSIEGCPAWAEDHYAKW